MSKEAIKLALVLEALVPFEKLFMQADEKDLLGGQNIDCQIATTDLRKLAYAAADLREALAEQPAQQEPVAWYDEEYDCAYTAAELDGGNVDGLLPLYTSPPAQRTWVGLTEEERHTAINEIDWDGTHMFHRIATAIEAKLKEKNT